MEMKEPETVADNGVIHSAGCWFESNRENHPGSPGMYDTLLSMTARKDEKPCDGVGYRHGHTRKISVMVSTAVQKTDMEVSDYLLGVRVLHLPPKSCGP